MEGFYGNYFIHSTFARRLLEGDLSMKDIDPAHYIRNLGGICLEFPGTERQSFVVELHTVAI